MEEVGVVKRVEGPMVVVNVQKRSVCEKCTAGTCHLTEDGAEIEALNEVGAQVGQTVRVALQPYSYLTGSLMIYGLPALALIVGAVVGRELTPAYFPDMDPDVGSAILGFGALLFSFIPVKIWSKFAEKKTEYKPVVQEIIQDWTDGD